MEHRDSEVRALRGEDPVRLSRIMYLSYENWTFVVVAVNFGNIRSIEVPVTTG